MPLQDTVHYLLNPPTDIAEYGERLQQQDVDTVELYTARNCFDTPLAPGQTFEASVTAKAANAALGSRTYTETVASIHYPGPGDDALDDELAAMADRAATVKDYWTDILTEDGFEVLDGDEE